MSKFFLVLVALFLVCASQGKAQSKSGTWSGILVYSSCNPDEAFNESPECFHGDAGSKLALYDDTNRVMYGLEPQERAAGHLGEAVTIHGESDGETISINSLANMSIGLSIGQKAPEFSLRDQFGHTQTLQSLKGANGTVLLFFRSADW